MAINSSKEVICKLKLQWLEHWWLVYRGWFELVFEFLGNSSDSWKKQVFRDISGIVSSCVLSLKAPHRGDSTEYTQQTLIEDLKTSPKLFPFASSSGAVINLQQVELPMPRINIHGPKDVRAIEVRLYVEDVFVDKLLIHFS